MSLKLEYLRKYNKKVEIIKKENLENYIYNIPVKWQDIVREEDFYVKKIW